MGAELASRNQITLYTLVHTYVCMQVSRQDKQTVFKARSNLKDTRIGMDDDMTRLQQERKNAGWPAFMEARAAGVRTQCRAEKLFVLKEGHFVEHKVLDLWETTQLGVLSLCSVEHQGRCQ